MKSWEKFFITIITALLGSGLLFLVNNQPRGEAITLRPAPTRAPMIIYVSGAVHSPGVYHLEAGSRVEDAINLAGGVLENAYVYNLNLAKNISDGEKISVSFLADPNDPEEDQILEMEIPVQIEIVFPIDLNTATQLELEALPVIGPSKAQDIINYRDSHGPFTSIEQIQNVYGIGPSTFEQVKDLIIIN